MLHPIAFQPVQKQMDKRAPKFAGLTRPDWICLALFAAIGFTNMWHHELWRDEFQAFFIARESASITDLLGKMRYEGHPPLWGLLLYTLAGFSANPLFMQLSNFLAACLSAYIILLFPVPRRVKALLIFGYFSIFEFLAIVRNYALGFLFTNAALLLIMRSPGPVGKKYLRTAPLLFLLSLTSAYGIIVAATLAFYIALDSRETLKSNPEPGAGLRLASGFLIIAAGAALSAVSVSPPADRAVDILVGFDLEHCGRRIASVMTAIWKSYVPVPPLAMDFWNDNFISGNIVRFILSVALLGLSMKVFFSRRNVFLTYCFGSFSILAFSFFVYNSPNIRHFGHLYIIFMICLVLAAQSRKARGPIDLNLPEPARLLVPIILIAQVTGGAMASSLDWAYPFTAGKSAAEFIAEQGLENHMIIGDEDYPLTTLSGYLNKPVYHLSTLKMASYVTWSRDRQRTVEPAEIVQTANILEAQGNKVLVALNYELEPHERGSLEKMAEFTRSVMKDEVFYLYTVGREKMNYRPETIRFNPGDLIITDFQNRWAIIDATNSRRIIAYFNQNRKNYAVNALLFIRHFGIDGKHTIGNTSFLLASGEVPERSYPGEEIQSFEPGALSVRAKMPGPDGIPNYELMNGDERLWNFGCNESAAFKALEYIKKTGITRLCRIGTFAYWRK